MILEKARFVLGQIAHGMIRPQKEINEAVDTVFGELDKRKWTPVTERLPEEDGRYLIFNQNNGKIYIDGWMVDRGWLFFESITAWMPLPGPWKGEENDK